MGIRRPGTKGYEEVDGVNVSTPPSQQQNSANGNGINNNLTVPEFELASVSVVPDGEIFAKSRLINFKLSFVFQTLTPWLRLSMLSALAGSKSNYRSLSVSAG